MKNELMQLIHEYEIELTKHLAKLLKENGANSHDSRKLLDSWLGGKSIEELKSILNNLIKTYDLRTKRRKYQKSVF